MTATDPQMRLLIIEDDRESADYLVKAFREVGYVADLAADGEEGLSIADSGDYDVRWSTACCRNWTAYPGQDVAREGNRTPVLIPDSAMAVDDRVNGLARRRR